MTTKHTRFRLWALQLLTNLWGLNIGDKVWNSKFWFEVTWNVLLVYDGHIMVKGLIYYGVPYKDNNHLLCLMV